MWPSAVFKGEPLPALPPPSWVSPLAPQRAQEAPAGAKPRLRSAPRACRAPSAGLAGAWLGARWGVGGTSEGGFPRESAVPRAAGGRAGTTCRRRHLYLLRGSPRGEWRSAGSEDGGRGGRRVRVPWVCRGVCACVRGCAGVCARRGEAVGAAAPWLRAGRGGIARFSPAGAGDLQAIPLYFRRELTSPAPPPQETPLTAAPSPPISRRGPSSAIPAPSLSP